LVLLIDAKVHIRLTKRKEYGTIRTEDKKSSKKQKQKMKKQLQQLSIFARALIIPLVIAGGVFLFFQTVRAATIPMAGIYNARGDLVKSFPNVKPGSSVAIGDIDKDGKDEIVIGSQPDVSPEVVAYEQDGSVKWKIHPYGSGMTAGLNVAIGDLTGYGNVEVVTVPRRGAGSQIMRFDGITGTQLAPGFFAFSPHFHGGANITIGNVVGDSRNEIIVGAGPGSSHVTVFDSDGNRIGNVFPYFASNGDLAPWGAEVAAADVNGDGLDEIIVGPQNQHVAEIKIFSWKTERTSFNAFGKFEGGVSLSVNTSGGGARLLLGAASGGGPQVLQFNLKTKKLDGVNTFPFARSWRRGVTVAFLKYTDQVYYFAVPGSAFELLRERHEPGKLILVDLSEQRLYAYENGYRVNTFLVSTGIPGMDTHIGTFHIYQKQYSKLYSGPWFYLPNTLYNMRYDGPRFLHGAYWHHNFGHPMSHGCVNIAYPNAEWLYNWAPMGTTVIVQQ